MYIYIYIHTYVYHRRFIMQREREHTRTGIWSESGFGSRRGAPLNISRRLGGESTPRPYGRLKHTSPLSFLGSIWTRGIIWRGCTSSRSYIYIHISFIYGYIHLFVYIYIYICTYIHIYKHTYIHTHTHINIYTYIHIYTYIRLTHTHMYTYICL